MFLLFYICCIGIYIRSERLSNKEGHDVFFLITAQSAEALGDGADSVLVPQVD